MKVAITVDDWKVPIFEPHLSKAGFTSTTGPGLTEDMRIIHVETEDLITLEVVVRAANAVASLMSKGGGNA